MKRGPGRRDYMGQLSNSTSAGFGVPDPKPFGAPTAWAGPPRGDPTIPGVESLIARGSQEGAQVAAGRGHPGLRHGSTVEFQERGVRGSGPDAVRHSDSLDRPSSTTSSDPWGGGVDREGIPGGRGSRGGPRAPGLRHGSTVEFQKRGVRGSRPNAVRRSDSLDRPSSTSSTDPLGGGVDREGVTTCLQFPGRRPAGRVQRGPRISNFGEQKGLGSCSTQSTSISAPSK